MMKWMIDSRRNGFSRYWESNTLQKKGHTGGFSQLSDYYFKMFRNIYSDTVFSKGENTKY